MYELANVQLSIYWQRNTASTYDQGSDHVANVLATKCPAADRLLMLLSKVPSAASCG